MKGKTSKTSVIQSSSSMYSLSKDFSASYLCEYKGFRCSNWGTEGNIWLETWLIGWDPSMEVWAETWESVYSQSFRIPTWAFSQPSLSITSRTLCPATQRTVISKKRVSIGHYLHGFLKMLLPKMIRGLMKGPMRCPQETNTAYWCDLNIICRSSLRQ